MTKHLWKYHPTERDLLAKFVAEGNDCAVNSVIREVGIIGVFPFLDRYARKNGPLCWILFGKEVRYQKGEESNNRGDRWWLDGECVIPSAFFWRLRDWIRVQALEAGIVVEL
jgi:hypothetical protein